MENKALDLSVIIACYDEEPILEDSFKKIKGFLGKSALNYEIIFVDDGSRDRTVEIAAKIARENDNVKLICHGKNMGRGKSVEDGIRAARGRVAGFLDIDLQVPAYYILPLVIEIEKGFDIATALRRQHIQAHMIHRHILSRGYNLLMRTLLRVGIRDSETGYKFFKREKILPVLDEIKNKHWFWDTEFMVRSFLKGCTIKEVPCLCIREEWQKSTVKIFRDVIQYLVNLRRFKKEVDFIRKSQKR